MGHSLDTVLSQRALCSFYQYSAEKGVFCRRDGGEYSTFFCILPFTKASSMLSRMQNSFGKKKQKFTSPARVVKFTAFWDFLSAFRLYLCLFSDTYQLSDQSEIQNTLMIAFICFRLVYRLTNAVEWIRVSPLAQAYKTTDDVDERRHRSKCDCDGSQQSHAQT